MNRKRRLVMAGLAIAIGTVACLYFSTLLHLVLSIKSLEFSFPTLGDSIQSLVSVKSHRMFFLCFEGFVLLFTVFLFFSNNKPYQSRMMQITPEISTPVSVGQKQHGSARWMTEKEKNANFQSYTLKLTDKVIQELLQRGLEDIEGGNGENVEVICESRKIEHGGILLGMHKTEDTKQQKFYYCAKDRHTLCIGATGSGKTRTVLLQSIGIIGLSGESMFLSDPKGELFQYTYPYLERLGYEVVALDFRNPLKSHCYNYLQSVVDAIDQGDIAKAINATWDITATLVGEAKGERIWNDGEASVIASSIMSVIYDNREGDKRKYQNMTNVYYFIAFMCKTVNNKMPILEYVKRLPDSHPAKALLAISEVAPARTRGSFYTAALSTLRLFTDPSIYSMTCRSDFNPGNVGSKKQAIFIILPDEKTTYYSLASLFVSQLYGQLVQIADQRGGRLEKRVHFNLEEFGNFVKIPDFANKLTVARSRGILFNLFIQSFAQLEEKYGREIARIIRGNCENWIYLQAEDDETLKEISGKLGNHTVSSYSLSANNGKYSTPSTSQSTSLMSRSLLTSDEVRLISRPYSLITSRSHPAIMYAPDLAETHFNRMFGLGNEKHNTSVREMRENRRPKRNTSMQDMKLWGVWKFYTAACMQPSPQIPRQTYEAGFTSLNDNE
ncbi:TRAG protein [Desulfosporosinus sp. I2]|uniref:VirD4-like conjugal transfer protein, CD1115 family n=1 Tax=Desulfosporosinus sp. I2 TaxID=1617025 RepID=UPI00061E9E27|nr:type IV secretory system conjugative DNA transfer family protein [Desulfosporosinus sp. I2]KJR45211.1 TRAG protein [Desulfosporosinus sp. I2]